MCGDSGAADVVREAMGGHDAELCLTDPPYGIGGSVSVKNKYEGYDDTVDNLVKLIGAFLPLAQAVASVVVLTPGIMNHRRYPAPTWTMAWFTPAGIGRGPWGFCCWQPILCFGKDPKLTRRRGSRPDATVTDDPIFHPEAAAFADAIIHTETSPKAGHPCAKPIKFWSWLLERTSERGDRVYDPFSGSGTTVIAAEMTGRVAHAVEVSPAYVDVGVRRWEAFTGREAILASDGRTLAEVGAARAAPSKVARSARSKVAA